MKTIRLRELRSVEFSQYMHSPEKARRLLIVVSGYESRSTAWFNASFSAFSAAGDAIWKVIGFNELRNALNRSENDKVYRDAGLSIHNFSTEAAEHVMQFIRQSIE